MVARRQTSAAGALALLTEPEPLLKQHALKALSPLVPQFWAEISEHIALIEALYEDKGLSEEARQSAALLASKVYYFLGEYDEALSFALGAGPAFNADSRTSGAEEYIETVVSKAIDRYIELRFENSVEPTKSMDSRLQDIVEGIFTRCIEDGEYKQALGIALEAHRLDVVGHIFGLNKDVSLLSYTMEAALENNFSLSYRDEVLQFLFPLYPPLESRSPHIHSVTRSLVTLGNPANTASFLTTLVPKETLLAYQIAFDLTEGGVQDFLESVKNELPEGDEQTQPIFDKLRQILTGEESVKLYLDFLKRNNNVDMLILKNTKDTLEARSSIYHNALTFQNAFMHAGTTSDTFLRDNLEWLGKASNWSKFSATAALGVIHQGHTDEGLNILGPYLPSDGGETTTLSGSQYSEGGALYAIGLINAGCGSGRGFEGYLREKMNAPNTNEVVQHGAALGLGVAGMGGKSSEAYDDLKQILFSDSAIAGEAAGYSMGLIMLGTGDNTCADEMLAYARDTQHEKIIRGLAIGLALIFYGRQEEADAVIARLLAEKDPILRYGGVYTLALAYAGSANNDAVRRLLHVAVSDTSDDVRRAAVTSLAFLLFRNPTQVPRIVQLLSESYNPHVRCGATLALGIACAGTGLQDAVEILDPMTKDPIDFVRQGAFIALGMILVQQSEALSPSVSQTRTMYQKIVADKHDDPMAKFGAALGQGLIDAGGRNVTISLQSRSGSRNTSAIVGMVLFCQFWYWYPLAHCATLAFEPTTIIGLNADLKPPKFEFVSNAKPSMFAYPPPTKPPVKESAGKVATAVLSTTAKVKAREKTKEKEKTTATENDAIDTDTKMEIEEPKLDTDVKPTDASPSNSPLDISPTSSASVNPPDVGSKEATPESPSSPEGKKALSASKKEPAFEKLTNFSRVTPAQLVHISFEPDGRYQPVRPVSTCGPLPGKGKGTAAKAMSSAGSSASSQRYAGGGGILLLIDTRPGEPEELIESVMQPVVQEPAPMDIATEDTPSVEGQTSPHIALDEDAPEAEPPEPFEYPFGETK